VNLKLGTWNQLGAGADGRDEPVSPPMRRLDVARGTGIIIERVAKLPDAVLQHGVADEGVRPNRVEQVLLDDELTWAFHQVLQDGKRFWTQRNGTRSPPQALVGRIEAELTEGSLLPPGHTNTLADHDDSEDTVCGVPILHPATRETQHVSVITKTSPQDNHDVMTAWTWRPMLSDD
jgi:hypothetical protein